MPAVPSGIEDCGAWVRGQVSGSLERLGVTQIDGLLLHRPQDLLGAHGQAYRQALQRLKLDGVIRAAGISIYRPDELDALWPVFRPDLVQAPFNVFDRRLETSGWLRRLSGEGVRVHTRSAFLQGLLLMPSGKAARLFQALGAGSRQLARVVPAKRCILRWQRLSAIALATNMSSA